MARKKKERGRPPGHPLPPRIEATPEQLAQAMFSVPADHRWKYREGEFDAYRCRDCERVVSYPEVLSAVGLCPKCSD